MFSFSGTAPSRLSARTSTRISTTKSINPGWRQQYSLPKALDQSKTRESTRIFKLHNLGIHQTGEKPRCSSIPKHTTDDADDDDDDDPPVLR